jgi:hypothetical protein
MGMLDTTPEAAAVQAAIHRRIGPNRRLRLAFEISDVVRAFAAAGTRIRQKDAGGSGALAAAAASPTTLHEGTVSVQDVFTRICAALQVAEVPHMLTGSFASSIHGAPRATQDIDIVIAPTREQLLRLLDRFPATEYYVSRDAALDALERYEQFNVIDLATGWKVDFIIRKTRNFSREEFDRRYPLEVEGVTLDVASAEDVLIAKLEWAKLGTSARQIDDAAGIIRIQGDQLNTAYVERWVHTLDLDEQWREARAKSV